MSSSRGSPALQAGYMWDPNRGLMFHGITRAAIELIKDWAPNPPDANHIVNHPTNPLHRTPPSWWYAQAQLYGLEYRVQPAQNLEDKVITEFRKSIATMNPFKPTKKIDTMETNYHNQHRVALQRNAIRITSSSPAVVVAVPPTNNGIHPARAVMIKQESKDDELSTTSGSRGLSPYVVPARRDLKRKEPPRSSDDEAVEWPMTKSRRVTDSSPVQETVMVKAPSKPSSYDIVMQEWVKVRSQLQAPTPPLVAMIPATCSKCDLHVRACKCMACSVCYNIEEACICIICDTCRRRRCACNLCLVCGGKHCHPAGIYCPCYCKSCKIRFRTFTAELTEPVCHCQSTPERTMQKRLMLLKDVQERSSEARQKAMHALTEQLSKDWLIENLPGYFSEEGTTGKDPASRTLSSIAGIYALYWNNTQEEFHERPMMIIQVEGSSAWASCSYGGKLTTMLMIDQVPDMASTSAVDCHLACPTRDTVSDGKAWDFGEPGLVTNVGGIRFLSDNLMMLDRSVAGITASATTYPSVLFAIKAAENGPEDARVRQLWYMKHSRCCDCGHTASEEDANSSHRWAQAKESPDSEWDEIFVGRAVAKLQEDPMQEFRNADRLFLAT